VRKVGAHLEPGCSRDSTWFGTRMANVQTTDRRLRFSIVVRFIIASCRELRVIPKVNMPKNPLLACISAGHDMERLNGLTVLTQWPNED
jgi:hypothetical protein